jgi:electron transfer flavoprotein alpha subunit
MDDPRQRRPGLRIAALVKQVPVADAADLDTAGRLRRGDESEMNAFCRRAVTQSVLLTEETGGRSTVFTMGPPAAVDVLRESVACGIDSAVHLCDAALAGSDTLVTAQALASAIEREGLFDLVLVGRSTSDSETASIGPQLAQILGVPFAGPVRWLRLTDDGTVAELGLELDGATEHVRVSLPAVLSTAERLCEAASRAPELWPAELAVRRYTAADLGQGPWGLQGSPTRVGAVRPCPAAARDRLVLTGSRESQARAAVDLLARRGAFDPVEGPSLPLPPAQGGGRPVVTVTGQAVDSEARALLGAGAALAAEVGGHVVAVSGNETYADTLGRWGADRVLVAPHCDPAPLADALAGWCSGSQPWAVLGTADCWGQEVLARLAVALDAGLIADALDLKVGSGRLIGDKSAFGGRAVVEIHCVSPIQCATVRPGALPLRRPRPTRPAVEPLATTPDARIELLSRSVNDASGTLGRADVVVGVGLGVAPEEYPLLDPIVDALDGELGGTRKVTDRGWLPHGRQIGTTGCVVSPRLYVAVGISGDGYHTGGIRNAGSILAVNTDPAAPIFSVADVGIVADWRELLPHVVDILRGRGLASTECRFGQLPMPAGCTRQTTAHSPVAWTT